MTTVQQIQQEIRELPEWTLEQLLDYVLFLKTRYTEEQRPEIPNAQTIAILKEAEEEYARGDVYTFENPDDAIAFLEKASSHAET